MLAAALLVTTQVQSATYSRIDEECIFESDCFDDFEVCNLSEGPVCEHKEIWPMTAIEWVGSVLIIIDLYASNCGGLGGGGSAIPFLIVFFGFDIKNSIAISNASICIASICRYIFNFPKSHPLRNGSGVLVDYNIASIMLPMIVVGATLGVMVNIILPSVVVAIVLTILLVIVSYTTFRKLLQIQGAERAKLGPFCCGKEKHIES